MNKGGSTVAEKESGIEMEKVGQLESLIAERLREKARGCSPGNSWVLNENNNVPEMIAKITVDLIKEISYK